MSPRLLIVSTVALTIDTFLTPFAHHFRTLGWTVDGMAAGLPASARASVLDTAWDISWNRNPLDPRNLMSASRVREVVSAGAYDIVHVHTPVASFVTRWALRNTPGPKVVYTAHGFHFSPELPWISNRTFLALERFAARRTDALVVINSDDRSSAIRYRLAPEGQVHLVNGIGIDAAEYDPGKVPDSAIRALRDSIGLAPETPLATMIAEYTPNKRHALVLQALALCRQPVHLALVGTGPLMDETIALARRLGIQDRVHVLGWRDDVPTVIAASDLAVLFSAREGLPRSVMEAMAMARPVIGSDIRGIRDLLSDGCGLLVPSGDVAALAEGIDRVIGDPVKAARMGAAGLARVRSDLELGVVIRAHERIYADLLSDRGGPTGPPV